MIRLQSEYNELLQRFNNACQWLDFPERTQEEVDQYSDELKKILKGLNILIKVLGLESGDKRILEGFKENKE